MFELDVGVAEALYTFLEELQGQVGLIGRQRLADGLYEDCVVRRNT